MVPKLTLHYTIRGISYFIMLAICAATMKSFAEELFVRVSERDAHYFEWSDGTPYIPTGFCLVPPPAENEIESVLSTMAENKINFCRIWLDQPPWNIEHEKSGIYDASKMDILKHFLDLANSKEIRVKLCIEYFRDMPARKNKWSDKIMHNVANGGPSNTMEEFLNSEKGIAQFCRKLDFYRAHLGDHPAVFAWELWNEVDCVNGDWLTWTKTMLPELHRRFPQNLVVQSLGSYDNEKKRTMYRTMCELQGNDIAQVHRYLDLGASWEKCHAPMDILASNAVEELRAFHQNKPILLAETGAVKPSHTGCSDLYTHDKDGMLVHDGIFAPFFAGAAGTGDTWWWRQSLEAPNQWHHYARFARAVEGIDPPAEQFQPITIPHERLHVYALAGKHTFIAWCRDSKNDWQSELEKGIPPEELTNINLDVSSQIKTKNVSSVKTYNPWNDRWSDATIREGVISLPTFQRSIVVKLNQ